MPTSAEATPAPFAAAHAAEEVRDYIGRLQRDGRLLLRFVARRVDRGLPPDTPAGAQHDGAPSDALFAPAEELLKTPARLAELLRSVDDLSRRAAPANVRSIRLTSAYLKIAMEGGEPPADIRHEARHVCWYMNGVGCFALLLLAISIGLLAHVDNGRRLLQQLSAMRTQEDDIQRDLAALPLAETRVQTVLVGTSKAATFHLIGHVIDPSPELAGPLGSGKSEGVQLCAAPRHLNSDAPVFPGDDRAITSNAAGRYFSWREPITQKALTLCRRYDDIKVRLAIIYSGLADWNCLSHEVFFTTYLLRHWPWSTPKPACGEPSLPLPSEIDAATWQSHEIWVSAATGVVAGFVLPLLFGCLGGCAYALRRVDHKLSSWTLEPQDGRHVLYRVALAAVLGGLVGAVWTSGDTVTLGGFTLSLAATAFFIGFSVEGVFKLIESLTNNISGSLGNTPALAGESNKSK